MICDSRCSERVVLPTNSGLQGSSAAAPLLYSCGYSSNSARNSRCSSSSSFRRGSASSSSPASDGRSTSGTSRSAECSPCSASKPESSSVEPVEASSC